MHYETIKFLNDHRFTVLFSGGKDSLCALLWVLDNVKHNNWNVLYIEITGNTHQLCTQYVYEIIEKLDLKGRFLHVKTRDFYELMDKWMPPLTGSWRWCLYHLKAKAIRENAKITVTGVRKSDSSFRKRVYKLIHYLDVSKTISIQPIFNWTLQEVLSYIKKHNMQLNPCYKRYGHSGNCMFCPYYTKKQIVRTMEDPEWRNKILSALLKHRDKMVRGRVGREVYKRWITYANQASLSRFLEVKEK